MDDLQMMRKLRSLSVMAYTKIWTNRFKGGVKQPAPNKWAEVGWRPDGTRDWRKCPLSFLLDKLDEEVQELRDECIKTKRTPTDFHELFKEAADVNALAMFLADWHGVFDLSAVSVPKVVCLCGSTRFKQEFMDANYDLTMRGYIVLSVGFFMHVDKSKPELTVEQKEGLDRLHLRKIDLADEIMVINVDGYIGESTRREIAYANMTGKPVKYLYPIDVTTQE